MKRRVAILISGRGSNMAALIDAAKAADFPAEIVAVISNRTDAAGLERAGLVVRSCADHTATHQCHASALRAAYAADRAAISRAVGARTLAGLLASHRLWCEWLAAGRVRKLSMVAERVAPGGPG